MYDEIIIDEQYLEDIFLVFPLADGSELFGD